MDPAILDEAYRYWFGDLAGPADFPQEKAATWFQPSPVVDDHIRATFGPYIDPAAAADWDVRALTRQQQIGLVVLLDQYPRNIFRDSGKAFEHDARAREIAGRLIEGGVERFFPIERMFLFLPLEHSEDFVDQERSVRLYRDLAKAAPDMAILPVALDFAVKHYALIARFDRFPHRNAVLGRTSTPLEAAFLDEHGRGF
jgi:uncharacterized protein (DUF924 family)